MNTACRETNSLLNRREFRERRTHLISRPRMVFLELTRRCNLRCVMCRHADTDTTTIDMSEDLLAQVRAELFPYVEAVDLRGNGESTLDPRLGRLLDELRHYRVRSHLYTNLATHDPRYWQRIASDVHCLAISVESASKFEYERIRRGAAFDTFMRNLAAIRDCIGRRGIGRHFCVHLSAVVLPGFVQAIEGLVQLAADHCIPIVRLNPLTDTANSAYPVIGLRNEDDKEELHDTLTRASGLARELGVRLELAATLDNSDLGGFPLCLHPWSYAVISADGSVVFCDHFVGDGKAIMGSLLDADFMTTWNSPRYQRLRGQHREQEFRELTARGCECDWCYRNRYADCEYFLEAEYMPEAI